MKKAFTLIEIITVFLLILLVASLVVPLILNDSKRANEISKWRHTYADILYTFKSLKVQYIGETEETLSKKISKAKTNAEKEDVLIKEFAPYLRITSKMEDNDYKIKYLNSEKVLEKQFYYFNNFYNTQNGNIIGIKWIGELYEKAPFVMLLFDVNGDKAPNTWGRDIFGINIYRDRIEPLGKNIPDAEVSSDCSKHGRGIYCSYDYLIGAQF